MSAIIFTGVAFAFFTSLVFLMRKPFLLTGKIVIFFMISLALPMIAKLNAFGIILLPFSRLEILKASPLLFGPFLYLYTKSEISERPQFKRKSWLHFIPFIIAIILSLLFFRTDNINNHRQYEISRMAGQADQAGLDYKSVYEDKKKSENLFDSEYPGDRSSIDVAGNPILQQKNINQPDIIGVGLPIPQKRSNNIGSINPVAAKLLSLSILVSFIIYIILIIKLLRSHEKKISEYFSYDSLRINLKWLKWITICFFLSYGFAITVILFAPIFIRNPFLNPRFAPDVGTTFFIFMFSLFAVKQPVIFRGGGSMESSNDEKNIDNDIILRERKYEKSGLKDSDAENFLKSLECYMRSEKPFLDPDLTIVSISEKLDIPKHYLTEIINRTLNKNFYTYVNEFRINEAKKKISDKNYSEHSIIRIAYDSGFNSKSTFNKIFKQVTSLTPSEYRQRYIDKEFM